MADWTKSWTQDRIDKLNLSRLCPAMGAARQSMEPFRVTYSAMAAQFAGSNWGSIASDKRVPINLLSLQHKIVTGALTPKNLKVMLSTDSGKDKAAVAGMQDWQNGLIAQSDFTNALGASISDSMFLMGFMKTGIASPADAAMKSWQLQAGMAFSDVIPFEDMVWDLYAKDFDEVSYIGHRYRCLKEVVEEMPYFKKNDRKRMVPDPYNPFNEQGDEKVGVMGRDFFGDQVEYEEYVTLWEIYLPRHGIIVTVPDGYMWQDESSDYRPVNIQRYIGHPKGPYTILRHAKVPGSSIGKGPMMDTFDLSLDANAAMRKLMRQAERMKQVPTFNGSSEDGERMKNANDGEFTRMDDPESIGEMVSKGPNAELGLFMDMLIQRFSWIAGNLDILGGLSPQSKTATQDKMLNENSSRSLGDMQDRVSGFTRDIMEKECWLYWHHPSLWMKSTWSPPGLEEISINREVAPAGQPGELIRSGSWADIRLRLAPYSAAVDTPKSKSQAIISFVHNIFMPMMPLMQSVGKTIDVDQFIQIIAELNDLPELLSITATMEPPTEGATAPEDSIGMPTNTTRNYTRESQPGRSEKGDQMHRVNAMMGVETGGNPNDPESAAA